MNQEKIFVLYSSKYGIFQCKLYNSVSVQTWFLTLWDEHRIKMFENRLLRSIFGPKREEVKTG
jgi:hypothetical protein